MGVTVQPLMGIGTRYDLHGRAGARVSVVVHKDGHRELNAFEDGATEPTPARADDDRLGAHRRQLPLELPCRAARVQRHGDAPEAQDGQVGPHEDPVVGGHEADAVTGLESQPGQPATDPPDHVAQLTVGRRPAPAPERHPVCVVAVDDAGEVHGA